jgi:hypothetical protein
MRLTVGACSSCRRSESLSGNYKLAPRTFPFRGKALDGVHLTGIETTRVSDGFHEYWKWNQQLRMPLHGETDEISRTADELIGFVWRPSRQTSVFNPHCVPQECLNTENTCVTHFGCPGCFEAEMSLALFLTQEHSTSVAIIVLPTFPCVYWASSSSEVADGRALSVRFWNSRKATSSHSRNASWASATLPVTSTSSSHAFMVCQKLSSRIGLFSCRATKGAICVSLAMNDAMSAATMTAVRTRPQLSLTVSLSASLQVSKNSACSAASRLVKSSGVASAGRDSLTRSMI